MVAKEKGAEKTRAELYADIIRGERFGSDPAKTLADQKRGFEQEANPLTPWSAIRYARTHSLPVPEWVLDYFSDRADVIAEIVHGAYSLGQQPGSDEKRKELREAEAVGRALGFGATGKGKSSTAKATVLANNDFNLALGVEVEMIQGANKSTAIYLTAERFSLSESEVRRGHDDWEAEAKRILQQIIEATENEPP